MFISSPLIYFCVFLPGETGIQFHRFHLLFFIRPPASQIKLSYIKKLREKNIEKKTEEEGNFKFDLCYSKRQKENKTFFRLFPPYSIAISFTFCCAPQFPDLCTHSIVVCLFLWCVCFLPAFYPPASTWLQLKFQVKWEKFTYLWLQR